MLAKWGVEAGFGGPVRSLSYWHADPSARPHFATTHFAPPGLDKESSLVLHVPTTTRPTTAPNGLRKNQKA